MPAVPISPSAPAQWQHYLRAVVDLALPGHTIRVVPGPAPVGTRSLPYPFHGAQQVHVVTAFNPAGHVRAAQLNFDAHGELVRHVQECGLPWWPAVGSDPAGTHAELSVVLPGLDDTRARTLGRVFGQDAVFGWTPTEWRLLDCSARGGRTQVSRWHATPLQRPRAVRMPRLG